MIHSTWLLLKEGRYYPNGPEGECSCADYTVKVFEVDSSTPPYSAEGFVNKLYCVSGEYIQLRCEEYELDEEEIEQYVRMGIIEKKEDSYARDQYRCADDSVLVFTKAIYSAFNFCKFGDVWIDMEQLGYM